MTSSLGADQAARSAKELYQRFRQLIHEGAKFLIVGGIGFVVVLGGTYALRFEVGLGKFTSVTIATALATVITFLGNRHWSFRHRQGAGARSETVLFFALNGVGLLIQYASIFVVTDLLGLSSKVWFTFANFAGIVIGTAFRFWSYRRWIWVQPEANPATLSRGRHRKGRTTPALQPAQPGMPQPGMPQPGMPQPGTAQIPLAKRARSAATRAPS